MFCDNQILIFIVVDAYYVSASTILLGISNVLDLELFVSGISSRIFGYGYSIRKIVPPSFHILKNIIINNSFFTDETA